MKLYTSGGPHPQVVAMFMAEKGVRIDAEKVDVRMNANRSPEHLARNPMGQVPTLQLDDGTCVSEIFAICEYLEDIRPVPALIGATPEEKAVTRMWARRIDLNIIEPLATSFRNGGALSLFKDRILTASEVSSGMRQMSDNCLRWLNDQMGGKTWICGDRFTLADIQLFCFMDWGPRAGAREPLGETPGLDTLGAWFERVAQRPSAAIKPFF